MSSVPDRVQLGLLPPASEAGVLLGEVNPLEERKGRG